MKKITKQQGFTIIELIITCGIISIGLLAVVSMIVNTFSITMELSSNLTASYLAQEGFEIVRRIRDENFIEKRNNPSHNWIEGLITNGENSQTGSFDYSSSQIGSYQDDYLKINEDGFFNYTEGEETKFKRIVTLSLDEITDWGEPEEYILITVEVIWERKNEEYNYKISTKLFNWY